MILKNANLTMPVSNKLNAEKNGREVKIRFGFRLLLFGLVLILIVAFGLFPGWIKYERANKNKIPVVLLNTLYKDERPPEFRISRSEYVPEDKTPNNEILQTDAFKLSEIEKLISKSVSENPDAENLYASGRLCLAKKDFYEAVKKLERAKYLDSKNAQIQNDLGVAYLEESKITGRNEDEQILKNWGNALSAFDRAIDIDPNFPEAYFNRAMALQKLNLQNQAARAWREYIQRDTASPWTAEAAKNLERLERNKSPGKMPDELIKDFLQAYHDNDASKAYVIVSNNREMIKNKLIPQQLIFLFLETENRECLSALKYIGRMEKEKTGDAYFSDIADYYESVSKKKHVALFAAQKAIRSGYDLILRGEYKKALNTFFKARELFLKTGDFWESKLSDYWIAYCHFQIDKIKLSTERLEKLLIYCQKNEFKWLAAHAAYWLSINSQVAKQLSTSIEYATASLKFSEDSDDFYNIQKSFSNLAELNLQVNQIQKSFFYLQKSLAMSALPESSVRQKGRDLSVAVRLFYSTRFYDAAGACQKEILDLYETEIRDISFKYIGLADLGNIYAAQGKFGEALEFAEQGKKVSETLADKKVRTKAIGYANCKSGTENGRL